MTWQLPAARCCTASPHRRPAPRRRGDRADHRRDNRIVGHPTTPASWRPPGCSASPSPSPIPAPSAATPRPPPLGGGPGLPARGHRQPCRAGDHARRRRTAARRPAACLGSRHLPDEAAAELLSGHASFLHRADFTSRFIGTPGDGAGLAVIDWPAAIAALNESLPCSGGEQDAPPGGQPRQRHYREPPRRPDRHRRPQHPAHDQSRPARLRTPAAIGIS